MKHARLIQLLALLNTIIAILGCIYFPEYIIYGLIAWAFVNIFGTNIAMHRFMAHRSFKTGVIREKILKYLTIISAFGVVLAAGYILWMTQRALFGDNRLEKDDKTFWGVGINPNTTRASFDAIIVGLSKLLEN